MWVMWPRTPLLRLRLLVTSQSITQCYSELLHENTSPCWSRCCYCSDNNTLYTKIKIKKKLKQFNLIKNLQWTCITNVNGDNFYQVLRGENCESHKNQTYTGLHSVPTHPRVNSFFCFILVLTSFTCRDCCSLLVNLCFKFAKKQPSQHPTRLDLDLSSAFPIISVLLFLPSSSSSSSSSSPLLRVLQWPT